MFSANYFDLGNTHPQMYPQNIKIHALRIALRRICTCTMKHNMGTERKVLSSGTCSLSVNIVSTLTVLHCHHQSGCSGCNNVTRLELDVFGEQCRDANTKHWEQAGVAALPHLGAAPGSILTDYCSSISDAALKTSTCRHYKGH